MNCRQARKLIPLAADRHLDEPAIERLNHHLASCHSCTTLLESQRAAIRTLESNLQDAAATIAVTDDFASCVMAAIATQDQQASAEPCSLPRWFVHGWLPQLRGRVLAAVGVCVVVFSIALLLMVMINRSLDSSPVASAQLNSGHLMTFTIRPDADGRMVAGVHAHRYCKVTRARPEALR